LSKDKFHGFVDFDSSSNNPNHVEINHRAHRAHRATNSWLTRWSRWSRWFFRFTTGTWPLPPRPAARREIAADLDTTRPETVLFCVA